MDRHVLTLLRAVAAEEPGRPGLVYATSQQPLGFATWTFDGVTRRVSALARGLRRVGFQPGMRVLMAVPVGPDLFVILLALLEVGAVPIVVDAGMGAGRMLRCMASTHATAFVGVPAAHAVRLLRPDLFGGITLTVSTGALGAHRVDDLFDDVDAPPSPLPDAVDDDLLLVAFTTGSTGPAKGVEITHGMLRCLVNDLLTVWPVRPGEAGLVTLALFAVVELLAGCTAVLAPMDFSRPGEIDPGRILATIGTHRVTHFFASPALLRRLAPVVADGRAQLATVHTIACGGAACPPGVVRAIRAGLGSGASVHTTYGSTEAIPIATLDHGSLDDGLLARTRRGEGVCVGVPLPHMATRIDADNGVGELMLAGPRVSRHYLDRSHDAHHKVVDADGTTWHRTGDLAWRDPEGRLWLCGRVQHRVRTPDGDRLTLRVEGVLDGCPGVRRTALVGVGPPGAQIPIVVVELADGARADAVLTDLRVLADAHPVTRGLTRFVVHPGFPVDIRHNAKIGRDELAVWAGAKLGLIEVRGASRALMAIPLVGWAYLGWGLVAPFTSAVTVGLWWLVLFLHVVVHPAQIFPGLPVARRVGHGTAWIVGMTIVFGATYWRPLARVDARELRP